MPTHYRFRATTVPGSLLLLGLLLGLVSACTDDYATSTGDSNGDTTSTAVPEEAKREPLLVDKVNAALPAYGPIKAGWALAMTKAPVKAIFLPPSELTYQEALVATADNDLVLVNYNNGEARWWTSMGKPITGEPFFSPYAVYVTVENYLYSIERYSGEILWRVRLPFPPSAGPTIVEKTQGKPMAYIPGLDGKVYAVEVRVVQWPPEQGDRGLHPDQFKINRPEAFVTWRFTPEGGPAGHLAVYQDKLYAADNRHYAYAIESGPDTWGKPDNVTRFRTQGPMDTGPVATKGTILLACRDTNLYATHASDMSKNWRYAAGARLIHRPTIAYDPYLKKDVVLQRTGEAGGLVALNLEDGEELWKQSQGFAPVALFENREAVAAEKTEVILVHGDKTLSSHVLYSGKENWRIPVEGFGNFTANTSASRILCTMARGRLLVGLIRRD